MERKKKECKGCGELSFLWARGRCKLCDQRDNPEKHGAQTLNKATGGLNSPSRTNTPPKARKPHKRKKTGEYELFLKIYAEKKGLCEITGKQIPFNVSNFAHILSKGAYPGFRLNPENILHVTPEIHGLYDNSDKETLLGRYPNAGVFYQLKDKLRHEYYNRI
jgi:hypothetical protein